MKKILTITVEITGEERVKSFTGGAAMIFFTGSAGGDFFHGAVSGVGTDTQKEVNGKMTLSARYILKGKDYTGKECGIFIENNAEMRNDDAGVPFITHPVILTDSENLTWMETGKITGKLIPGEKGPVIEIYSESVLTSGGQYGNNAD